MSRAKLSPIFAARTPPARPGVYRFRFNLHIFEWRYARWDGKRWRMPNMTAKRAASEVHRISKVTATYGLWRGLAEKPA